MEEKSTKPVGTSDMPTPQTFAYEKSYIVSDLFKRDLTAALNELPYADAAPFIDGINMYPQGMPAAALNEFIRALGRLPYKYIAPLMKALDNKENFEKYFKLIENKQEQK